jgi:hypothetical protein
VRLRAPSPPYSQVPLVLVDEPGHDRCSLLCGETTRRAPQLMRRWRQRTWRAWVMRPRKPLWAPAACQGQSEDAYDGPLG